MKSRLAASVLWVLSCASAHAQPPAIARPDSAVPRYAHIFVILEENKAYNAVLDPAIAPNLARWARQYGSASQFYGEVHPSEANYVALLGGDTFGIHDDDAFYCKSGLIDPLCPNAAQSGYVDHTVQAPQLGDQLLAAGLSWKAYLEDLPAPGSLIPNAGSPVPGGGGTPSTALYASKHAGFVNFASVQSDPDRARHLVDFTKLDADLTSDSAPSFALIVPNQCNEMHGLAVKNPPPGCNPTEPAALIHRGDAVLGEIIKKIQASSSWRSNTNFAIVITFDEGLKSDRQGCCSTTPQAPSNYGGGHIPTLVITNHGPRGKSDATPYNHYSLLRTIEDAFGIETHLGRAADTALGVVPMTPLFAIAASAVSPF